MSAPAAVSSIRPITSREYATLRSSSIADRDRIREFLVGLSTRTSYQRFLTGMGTPAPRLVTCLATGGGGGAALLAEVDGVVVGHGLWAPVAPRPLGMRSTAEIAVVIADVHQRHGVGTALAQALVLDLSRRGFDQARVVTSSDNRAVLHMVARREPSARPERDGPVYSYDLPVRADLGRVPRSA